MTVTVTYPEGGLLLFVGGYIALVLAARSGQRAWVWATAVGLTGIIGAIIYAPR